MTINGNDLIEFVRESNKIEKIVRWPTFDEVDAHEDFLDLDVVRVRDIEDFVHVCQPGAKLRLQKGMDVRVGNHFPPPGGPGIGYSLDDLVRRANESSADPYLIHCEFESLHPFLDGNGRSGRVLWAWMMLKQEKWPGISLGFLHPWYYQSLSASRPRR